MVPPLPRYSEVLRLPAAHFAALRFLRWAIPSLRPWFVPPAPDAEPWINLELVGGISSRLARWKRQGLPSSRRNPCDHSPYSSDPGVTRQAEWTMRGPIPKSGDAPKSTGVRYAKGKRPNNTGD